MSAAGWMKQAAATVALFAVAMCLSGVAPAEEPAATPAAEVAPAPEAATPAEGVIKSGDLVVTGFSGTILAGEGLAPGVDPVDRTSSTRTALPCASSTYPI
ncbi:MAG: hypothetical protein WDN31_01965 [Hyphomicrobium sp.]